MALKNTVLRICKSAVLTMAVLLFVPMVQAHHRDSVTVAGVEFVRNDRQWDGRVLYKASLHGGALFAERDGFTFVLLHPQQLKEFYAAKFDPAATRSNGIIDAAAYKMVFAGANSSVKVSGHEEIQGYNNYYIGKDPARWSTRVPKYRELFYENLYDGIDLTLSQSASHLKYEFTVAPGASPSQICMDYDGIDNLVVSKGNLIVSTSVMQVVELQPFAYQEDANGLRETVPCRYKVNRRRLTFEVGSYDPTRPLVIDPVLIFSSYSGSTADNWGYTATYDKEGNLYSGGNVFGVGYPVSTGPFQIDFAGGSTDIAISKFDVGGSFLHFSTYLGGTGTEVPHSLVVNDNNELYVLGTTSSSDFPVTPDAFDTTFNGGEPYVLTSTVRFTEGSDIIIAKFNDTGTSLLGATYVGGSNNDGLNTVTSLRKNYADEARGEIIIDGHSNVYVASCTQSWDFPVTISAFDTAFHGGNQDACIIKFNHNLTNIIWCSYLGGMGDDAAYSIVLSDDNSMYVCGGTTSSDLPTSQGVVQPAYGGGTNDGFIAHIDPNGTQIQQITYLGKDGYDQAYLVKNDKQGNPHVFGQTYAAGTVWVVNADWYVPNGGQFLTKLSPELDSIIWSTAFGTGSIGLDISPTALLVDLCNNIYMSGWGSPSINGGQGGTSGLPITADAFQTTTDNNDYYFLCISDDASQLVYATYFGSPHAREHVDGGTSRFDNHGRIYQAVCAGCGNYDDFPTTEGAWSQTNNSTNCNIGVIKFDFNLPAVVADFHIPNTVCAPVSLVFHNTSQRISDSTTFFWDFGDGTTSTAESPTHSYAQSGTYVITLVAQDAGSCNFADTAYRELVVLSNSNNVLGDVGICNGDFIQIGIPPSGNSGITYEWQPQTGLSNPNISNPIAAPEVSTTYYLFVSDGVCIDTITQYVEVENLQVDAGPDRVVCAGTSSLLSPVVSGSAVHYYWSTSPTFSTYLNTDFSEPQLEVWPTGATTYYLRVEGTYCTVESSVNVQVSDFTLTSPDGYVVCYGDSTQLSVTPSVIGTYSYSWQPEGAIVSGGNSAEPWVRPLQNTVYTVTATNEYGCTVTLDVPVQIRRFESQVNITDASCHGGYDGSVSLTVTGGVSPYFYNWSNGATTTSLTDVSAGLYTVTVTDNTGCKGVDSFRVVQPEPLAVQQVQMQPVFCDQSCNGWVSVNAVGGTGPYTYTWLHGASGCVASELCAGLYTVQVTDGHGCRTTGTFSVADSSGFDLACAIRPLSCAGDCDAAIALTTDFAPFAHQVVWNQNPLQTGDSIGNLCAGTYQASVTVENGCSYNIYLQIDSVSALRLVNLFATPPLCYGDENGILQTDIVGGTSPYRVEVNGTEVELPLEGLAPGTYNLSVTDAAGCRLDTLIELTQPDPLQLSEYHRPPPCAEVCLGAIDLVVAGGTEPHRYVWSTGEAAPSLDQLCVGNYAVTVTDRNGCTATLSVELTDSTTFPTDITAWCDEDTLYVGQTTTLHATELGSPFQYFWNPLAGLENPTASSSVARPVVSTTYVVVVTDEFGCTRTDTVPVYVRDVICEEPYVFVPNAFTPNGDGKNDILYVRGEVVTEVTFMVYDRWGEKVFETHDLTTGWDGTFRGRPCEPGVYDYHLQVTCLGMKRYFKKGNVTLLR
ncbi:MAG: gliding motility-associated C-terminal domain-containing protein [Bacteroidales bacterium]|nr:gliding motility-associated C-terminal domain-containing protein [Bacteroidales bacterium]